MSTPQPRPLLTRDDLSLDAIAEICRRWGVRGDDCVPETPASARQIAIG